MKNPLSLEAFADWCERKPADEEYDWFDCNVCAASQYAKELGISNFADLAIPGTFLFRASELAFPEPHTFGALAERLREAAQ